MRNALLRVMNVAVVAAIGLGISGCSYNKFTTQEEAIKAQWALGWFKTLKASARKLRFPFSDTDVRFSIPRSVPQYPGPRPMFRPAFPHVPFAGTVNAAGLNQCASVCPPGGMIDMPGT